MNEKTNLRKTAQTKISIDSQAVVTAMRAIKQPKNPLVRVRVRDGCLEFVCLDDLEVVQAVARIRLEGSVEDFGEFEADRFAIGNLAARSDEEIQIRSDETMLALRSGSHIYSSLSQPETEDPDVTCLDDPVHMELGSGRLRELIGQINAPRVVFTSVDGDLWLSGSSVNGNHPGGPVRIPPELVTAADSDNQTQTVVEKSYLERCVQQLPVDSDVTVDIGDVASVRLHASTGDIDTRHTVANRIYGEKLTVAGVLD